MSTLAEQAIPIGTWRVDPAHSQVGFAIDYMGGTFRAGFSPVDVTLEVGEDGALSLTGSAAAESVKVQDENLNAHLLSPEFFDAERTPELRFRSREVRVEGREIAVAGELTVKGKPAGIDLAGTIGDPLTDAYGRERIGLTLGGTVDRTRLDLTWNLPLPSGEPALANDVALTAELYLVKG
jgi:polyisoprenoid-binding protein YceI